jgi:hypothetical protein
MYARFAVPTASERPYDEIAELLKDLVRVMQERAQALDGVTRLHEPTVRSPLIVLVIDEIANLTAYLTDRKVKDRVLQALGLLLTQGRAIGISVIAALQDPRREVLQLRNLFRCGSRCAWTHRPRSTPGMCGRRPGSSPVCSVRAICERSVYSRAFSTAVPARRASSSASIDKRQSANDRAARRHRHRQARADPNAAQKLEMLVVLCCGGEHRVRDLVDELRTPVAHDLRGARGPGHGHRVALTDAAGERHLVRIDVGDRNPPEVAVAVGQAHQAPVSELRDGKLGDLLQRSLVVQRRREELASTRQQMSALSSRSSAAWNSASPSRPRRGARYSATITAMSSSLTWPARTRVGSRIPSMRMYPTPGSERGM